MSLPSFSVRRPIFTTMVTLIVIIMGLVALSRIKIDLLPSIELPTISVRTGYDGASPEVMERLVTQIVEEIIATVPGVEEMTSESTEGSSNVRVTFVWGTDVDAAALDVQAKLEDEINELPDDIVRPRVSKFDIDSFPVVLLGISSDLNPIELTELIENQLRHRFAQLPGVAQVDLWGGFNREVRIELDDDRIRALNLPFDTLVDAIENSNLDLPTGQIEQGRYEITLRAPAEYYDLEQIRQTVIANHNGSVITLGQVANVVDTYEKLDRIIRVNGQRGVRVAIRKQASANTVEVSKLVLEKIDELNETFPQIKIVPVINQGNFIERSIANVAQSVLYGGALAVIILLLFLRNLRSTLVISVAIPISVIATFALIYFGGFTLNLMTLGGLALGVGMMVDSSVVVLENIFRRRTEQSEAIATAAVEGTKEVGTAIVASTITTLVIFLPLIFVRGVSGILFKELAYVIIFSLICSLMVSLSLVPMLASKLLAHVDDDRPGIFHKLKLLGDAFFNAIDSTYKDILRWVLHHRLITLFTGAAMLAASLLLLPLIGTEFLPPSDEGEVRVTGIMEVGMRLDIVDKQTRLMEEIVLAEVPEIVSYVTSVVPTSRRATQGSEGEMRISLTPATQRTRSNSDIATHLRKRLEGQIPGMKIKTRAPQGQFLLERLLGGDEGLKIEIYGFELETLDLLARQVAASIQDIDGITDIEISRETGIPQQNVIIDRAKVADLGVTVRDVTEVLGTAVAGQNVGDFRSQGNSYRMLVQLHNAERRSIDEILDLTVTSASGEAVALRNLVHTRSGEGPVVIERKDQQRIVTVEANVNKDRDLGSIAADVSASLATIPRPVGYDLMVAGTYEEQQKAFNELILALILALVFVYMVLACQYESLVNPLIVMFSVPLAAIGVLLMLFITETTLNLQSYIGCIMLGGIVVNNAILLVDQAGQLAHRMSTSEAVAEAGRRRLRPILMTTLTTILALIPLALGIGEGADAQAPLARAVIGGLSASTLITLVLIPALYSLIHPERHNTTESPSS